MGFKREGKVGHTWLQCKMLGRVFAMSFGPLSRAWSEESMAYLPESRSSPSHRKHLGFSKGSPHNGAMVIFCGSLSTNPKRVPAKKVRNPLWGWGLGKSRGAGLVQPHMTQVIDSSQNFGLGTAALGFSIFPLALKSRQGTQTLQITGKDCIGTIYKACPRRGKHLQMA